MKKTQAQQVDFMSELKEGIIIKGIGGFYYVETADAVYECKARGNFRRAKISPLVGDKVKIIVNELAENRIEEIMPRKNSLVRPPLANVDCLIIVASMADPAPNTLVIDKLTAIAESKGIEPVIIFNKCDLASADELCRIYSNSGFKTFAVNRDTVDAETIKGIVSGKLCAFTGNSGVGKSTILNKVDSRLALETGEISKKLGRGRHTTRHVELFKVGDGYVADTPGFSSLDIEKCEIITKDKLPECFREFSPYIGMCKFTSCAHVADKGCAVVEAVEKGEIEKSRHDSYVAMYNEVKDLKEWQMK